MDVWQANFPCGKNTPGWVDHLEFSRLEIHENSGIYKKFVSNIQVNPMWPCGFFSELVCATAIHGFVA